jgi:Xaa-Pro aminopeptidase
MKKAIIWVIIAAFLLSGLAAAVFSNTPYNVNSPAIRVAPPAPKFTDAERQAEFARRKAAVAAKMADNSMLILFSAQPKLYTNDVDYIYRQENNLVYLTGLKQDGAFFVLSKNGGVVTEYLFMPRRNPFFETWNGKMYSEDDAKRISGIKTILDIPERTAFRNAMKSGETFVRNGDDGIQIPAPKTMYMLLPNSMNDSNGRREYRLEEEAQEAYFNGQVQNARPIFDELRQIKSPYEIKLLQHAIDISNEAHMRSQAMAHTAKFEYEVQAEVEYTFRRRNADFWGYPSIVGCGPNATTLHYQIPADAVKMGDLLLMDVGAEYEHYTADITRTFPVNGKFTKEQREIYQIVYDAQEAVAKATKPGVSFGSLDQIARNTIEDGLLRVGLITEKGGQQSRIWFMHGLGHWLGMNVHDVSKQGAPLAAGMVFTNEPGIYIRLDALDNMPKDAETQAFVAKIRPAFEKYKGIGVRIEDDMLVTANGVEWMTKDLPRTADAIEAFIAKARKP